MLKRFHNWIIINLGDHAPVVATIAVIGTIMGGYLGFTIGKELGGINKANDPSEIRPYN